MNRQRTLWQVKQVPYGDDTLRTAHVMHFGGRKFAHIFDHSDSCKHEHKSFEVEMFPAGDVYFADNLKSAKLMAEVYFAGVRATEIYGM